MCGRYAITLPPDAVRAYFRYVEQPNFPPRYNIAPTQPISIVRLERERDNGAHRHFALVRWGLLPSWVKDPRDFPLIINARDDMLLTKASFRAAIRHRRCIVIADGFYEWRKTPMKTRAPKQPFLIRRRDGQPMAFAGLWESWLGADGSELDTACIVTTHANGLVSAIHDRMPAILDPRDFDAWLDERGTTPEQALRLIRPAPDDALEMIEIGPDIGKAANDGAQLQRPVGRPISAQTPRASKDLFDD
jgi:putative SOS response-associated peptidase YedK